MTPITRGRLLLGPLRIDLETGEVSSDVGESDLPPRAEALLLLLCRHANSLVSRDRILDNVWDGRIVEDAAITNTIWQIRRALGEARDQLQTRSKRGYLLSVPDSAWLPEEAPVVGAAHASNAAVIAMPSSLAVVAETMQAPEAAEAGTPHATQPAAAATDASPTTPTGQRRSWRRPALVAMAMLLVAAAGVALWGHQQRRESAGRKVALAEGADLTVNIRLPHREDWLQRALLRVAAEQALLREREIVRLEQAPRARVFDDPHLQIDVRRIGTDSISAVFELVDVRGTLNASYQGAPQEIDEALSAFLGKHLPPHRRRSSPATDAYVNGVLALTAHSPLGAATQYRRAVELDPQLVPARLGLVEALFTLGRTREAMAELEVLRKVRSLTAAQRCRVDQLLAQMTPERDYTRMCALARMHARLQEWDARGALREIQAPDARAKFANTWYLVENGRINAYLLAQEWTQAEAHIASASAQAQRAGWESARIAFEAQRALSDSWQGRLEAMLERDLRTASRFEALGDIPSALDHRSRALDGMQIEPGPQVLRQRRDLRALVQAARAHGLVEVEVRSLQTLLPIEQDVPQQWRQDLARARQLVEQHYVRSAQASDLHFLQRNVIAQRSYAQYLKELEALSARFAGADPQTDAWVPLLWLDAQFLSDDGASASATLDRLQSQSLDLTAGYACYFGWIRTVLGQVQRARELLQNCKEADYDRAAKAHRGDWGLLSRARLAAIEGEPERSWPLVKTRIEALLATPQLNRKEAESLTLLSRHATAMPGADHALLRRALDRSEQMSTLPGASNTLRFGVHVLRWRLCRAAGEEDCGPVLPDWAQEDRLEARLAQETRLPMR